jgi:hypothetical protein
MDELEIGTWTELNELVALIRPILAGRAPGVQGGVCAALLARFLAGHVVAGDREATAVMRDELIELHVKAVRSLVPLYEARSKLAQQIRAQESADEAP